MKEVLAFDRFTSRFTDGVARVYFEKNRASISICGRSPLEHSDDMWRASCRTVCNRREIRFNR